uniref:Autophagy-related protein 13-like n=2 Tax=Dermatophagoides pteronyssinus TaxID=6956 RepID=A0A6P6XTI3_DERPT
MSLKDIDKFISQFVHKCTQVIVQSRLGNSQRTKTKCNPNGKDWFNLDIVDIKDVYENAQKCLKHMSCGQQMFFVQKEWKICCEILLKNADNISITLEYWIFSNHPLINEKDFEQKRMDEFSQKVYEIFIRMSNMIKSLIVLTRSTPAYRLSSKGQSADSYVICYRIYPLMKDNADFIHRLTDQTRHYSPLKTIGVIRSDVNELSLSFIYRIDMNVTSESEIENLTQLNETAKNNNDNNQYFDDEEEDNYIVNANKQLSTEDDEIQLSMKDDHFKIDLTNEPLDMFDIIKPLNPAFASKDLNNFETDYTVPFSSLLSMSKEIEPMKNIDEPQTTTTTTTTTPKSSPSSNPIKIPSSKIKSQSIKSPTSQQIYSTSNESFVFVELNAPFASEESLLQSFFNGPSPTFIQQSNDSDSMNDMDELSIQLAELESAATQIDSFVESICVTNENEDLKLETKRKRKSLFIYQKMTTIETKKLLEYRLNGTDMIYDCQFHSDHHDWIGFSTIEGDIKIMKFTDDNDDSYKPTTVYEWKKYHRGNPIRKIRFHQNRMFSISKSIKITDLQTQKLIRKISNGKKKIYSLLVIDDYLVCIGDDDGNFKCWDYRIERPIHMSLNECDNYISDLDIDSNRQFVFATSGEGTLSAFNIRSRRLEPPQSELFDAGFQSVRYLEEKNKVIVGCEDGVINIFNNREWGNISDRYPIRHNNAGTSSIDCMEVIDDEQNFLIFGTSDGSMEIISLFPHQHHQTLIDNQLQGIECIDVNQITNRIIGTTENQIYLYQYELIKSADNDNDNEKRKKTTYINQNN